VRRRLAVDRSFVSDFSFWIDYHHVWRVLWAVSAAHFAVRIEKQRSLLRLPRGCDFLGLFRRQIAFGTRRIGIDGQPYHALVCVFFLQFLHVIAAVLLFHLRLFRIKPFVLHVLASVLLKRLLLAF